MKDKDQISKQQTSNFKFQIWFLVFWSLKFALYFFLWKENNYG